MVIPPVTDNDPFSCTYSTHGTRCLLCPGGRFCLLCQYLEGRCTINEIKSSSIKSLQAAELWDQNRICLHRTWWKCTNIIHVLSTCIKYSVKYIFFVLLNLRSPKSALHSALKHGGGLIQTPLLIGNPNPNPRCATLQVTECQPHPSVSLGVLTSLRTIFCLSFGTAAQISGVRS